MPLNNREHIKPTVHGWIADGFARWSSHEAMRACVKLAEKLLHYAEPGEKGAGWLLIERHAVAGIFRQMRDHGITPEQLFLRVAEYVAFFNRHPERAAERKVEEFALARGVLHLLPWSLTGRRHGARVLKALGQIVKDHLYVAANAFVRRLEDDDAEKGALLKQAVRFN